MLQKQDTSYDQIKKDAQNLFFLGIIFTILSFILGSIFLIVFFLVGYIWDQIKLIPRMFDGTKHHYIRPRKNDSYWVIQRLPSSWVKDQFWYDWEGCQNRFRQIDPRWSYELNKIYYVNPKVGTFQVDPDGNGLEPLYLNDISRTYLVDPNYFVKNQNKLKINSI